MSERFVAAPPSLRSNMQNPVFRGRSASMPGETQLPFLDPEETDDPFQTEEGSKVRSKEHVTMLTEEMFRKVAEYMRGELLSTSEDYKLLESMNNVTRDRYSEMSAYAQGLMEEMSRLQTTYDDFQRYIIHIDEISQQVDEIEKIANELDDYSKYLEAKLKRLSTK